MILSTTAILLLAIDGKLTRSDGMILLVLYIPYMIAVIRSAIQDSARKRKTIADLPARTHKIVMNFLFDAASILCIIYGAKIALVSGETLGSSQR